MGIPAVENSEQDRSITNKYFDLAGQAGSVANGTRVAVSPLVQAHNRSLKGKKRRKNIRFTSGEQAHKST